MIYKDEKTGSLKHEKYKNFPEQVPCSKCNVGYIYAKSPLVAKREAPTTDKKGNFKKGKKTGVYECKRCLLNH